MSIVVYHLDYPDDGSPEIMELYRNARFHPKMLDIEKALQSNLYRQVAVVSSDDLESAFKKTNSIDSYWGDNKSVQQIGNEHRSTSVGDLMLKDSKIYFVDIIGFKQLSDELISILSTTKS